ncbi:hypothetical protein NQ317_008688 [Molorchus minor]|uniref:Uncharacterized protein n=1 Tax=Molorchus minor TaxID=1323400 RepID=A0ABQ9K0U9_9CUCU|nr:hypothetical protein NQ317_008688 [Molorchus minor]
MKTEKKVFIKVESQEQQETTKNSRRTLKVLQQTACDKENLAGRPQSFKDAKFAGELEKPETKRKKVQMQHKAVQVGECVITADDLTWTSPVPIIGENLQKRGAKP